MISFWGINGLEIIRKSINPSSFIFHPSSILPSSFILHPSQEGRHKNSYIQEMGSDIFGLCHFLK